jgi:hypothetical protein
MKFWGGPGKQIKAKSEEVALWSAETNRKDANALEGLEYQQLVNVVAGISVKVDERIDTAGHMTVASPPVRLTSVTNSDLGEAT